jgi:hypothetical protein
MSPDRPLARSEGLITEELDGELLVYDSESNLAHALDPDAVSVWRACDGRTDSHALAVRCSTSEEDVRMTLARLQELGLLEAPDHDQDGDTRRSALRKIGIAGAGVATISSILVPIASAAGSCVQEGNCVVAGQTCCTGHPIDSPNCIFPPGIQFCCHPTGSCATGVRDSGPRLSCCSGNDTPDSSCPSGSRCTDCIPAGACANPETGFGGHGCCSGNFTSDSSCTGGFRCV